MSIVADMLSNEVALAAAPQPAPNVIPAILNVLTANATNRSAPGVTPVSNITVSNTTVVAPTLSAAISSAALQPPPSQAKSDGSSTAIGILASIIAAAGIAYLLV